MQRARTIVATATMAVLAATLAVPASAEIVGDFRAGADADLIEVSALGIPPGCGEEGVPILGELIPCDFEAVQAVLGDTEAAVDSTNGLSNVNTGSTGLSSYGHGSNVDIDALTVGGVSGNISADLILEANAEQPGGNAADEPDPISVPADPLLHVNLSTVTAHAVDVGAGNNTCPISGEDTLRLADGRSELVGLAVLPDALGEGMDVVGVEDPEGVSYAESFVDAVDSLVPGPNWGLQSTARLRLAPVTLFGGALDVQISDPVLRVSHDGVEPTIEFTPSIVTINGEVVVDGETIDFLDALDIPGSPVINVTTDIANVEDLDIDGTTVTATDVVRISVVLADTLDVLTISLGDLSAAAEVPAGGISFDNCGERENPLRELYKTSSAAEVTPGETFEYTIVVKNSDDECTLTDVSVTDVVTGPAGSSIVSTTPEADSTDGLTLTWDDIGPIAPNTSVTLQIVVLAPADAADGDQFTDNVSVSALCDDEEFEHDVEIVMPVVNDPPAPDGCFLGDSAKTATHEEVVPNETFSYLVHVFNTGNDPCLDIEVVDTLPPGFNWVSCAPACANDGQTVTFTIDELAPGASQTLAITVTAPDETGQWDNIAVITADNSDDDVTVSTDCPLVDDESILKPPDPPGRSTFTVMPKTGGGAALIGLAGLLTGAAALRRRHA